MNRCGMGQKLTTNAVSHAGQSISRRPGRRRMRRRRSHDGQATSTFGTAGVTTNSSSHDPQRSKAGRSSTPQTSTLWHDGQATFSSRQARRVAGWSTLTLASHKVQAISPRPVGSNPLQRGHVKPGGAMEDSTSSRSLMPRAGPSPLRSSRRGTEPRGEERQGFLGVAKDA